MPFQLSTLSLQPPQIPDHQLLKRIGRGSYGEVWLARNIVGTLRAVKVVRRATFERTEHFEREFNGLQKFELVSRSHEGLVDILQIGRNDADGYFYYVMELADDAQAESEKTGKRESETDTALPQVPSSRPPVFPSYHSPRTLRAEQQRQGRLPLNGVHRHRPRANLSAGASAQARTGAPRRGAIEPKSAPAKTATTSRNCPPTCFEAARAPSLSWGRGPG